MLMSPNLFENILFTLIEFVNNDDLLSILQVSAPLSNDWIH